MSDTFVKHTKPLIRICRKCGDVRVHYPLLEWCKACRKAEGRTARERYEGRWHRVRLGKKDRVRLSYRVHYWYRKFLDRWARESGMVKKTKNERSCHEESAV